MGQTKSFIVIELQGEPWTHKQIYEISPNEQMALLPFQEFSATLDYAKQAGFDEYYLWGAEWWYYLKSKGQGEYWDGVKELVGNK